MIQNDYISRHDALKALIHEYANQDMKPPGLRNGISYSRQIIQQLPAADVAPVVHGRWDDSFDGITPYCTICGRSHSGMNRTPPFCPHCGAKMNAEQTRGIGKFHTPSWVKEIINEQMD